MSEWYVVYNGQQVGPMKKEQLLSYGLTPTTKVWKEGMPNWVEAFTIPELMDMINEKGGGVNPPVPGPTPAVPASGKEKTVAGILAILLGGLGVQYFYIGKVAGGVVCLLLSLFTCGLWTILTLIQGIMMLTMTQEEFEKKYVYSTSFMPLF